MNLALRDLASFDDLKQSEALEREVWGVSDRARGPQPPLRPVILSKAKNSWQARAISGF